MGVDIKSFVEYEKEYGLFDRTYNDFAYWQSIRFSVCSSLFDNSIELDEKRRQKRGLSERIKIVVEIAVRAFKEAYRLHHCGKIDMLCFKHEIIKEKFFDTWDLPANTNILTFRNCETSTNLPNEDIYMAIPHLVQLLIRIYYCIFSKFITDRKERVFLNNLVEDLKNTFGKCLSAVNIERMIIRSKAINISYERYYRKILSKLAPKFIVVVCYYQTELFPLYKVAKEKGIPVIELQHGVVNNHQEYWFEDKRGKNNYIPDYLLTFGEKHSEWVNLLPNTNVVAVGFPFQENQIEQYSNLKTDDKTIIVYPQTDERFEKVIYEVADILHEQGYKIIVKLHPLQSDKYEICYPILSRNKNIEFVTRQDEGIYYWLKIGKHHIMASTTVGLEAMAFDHCNVCIAEMSGHEQTQCLLDWKVARGFNNASELIDLIRHPIDNSDSVLTKVRNDLWKRNATKNMESFFSELLTEQKDCIDNE